jgi:hypothetical protein
MMIIALVHLAFFALFLELAERAPIIENMD